MRTKVTHLTLHPAIKKIATTLIKGLKSPGNRSPANQHWRISVLTARNGRGSLPSTHHVRPRNSLLIKDNYCVNFQSSRRLARNKQTLYVNQCHRIGPETVNCVQYHQSGKTLKTCQPVIDFANSVVVIRAHIVNGQPQKKSVSPAVVRQHQLLKYENNVSCVHHLSSVNLVTNVRNVASDLPVVVTLHQFGKAWEAFGAGPKYQEYSKKVTLFPSGPDQT